MRKLIIALTLINLVNFNLSANNTFKSGFIINLDGDTIKGYLLEQSSVNASKKCVFKTDLDKDKVVYSPNDIIGYRYIDGKYYISKSIKRNKDKVEETVFMEFFIKGIACIYYFVNEKGEHYYIEKAPFGLVELSDLDLTKENEQKGELIYKGKLKLIMADCPEIENEINNTILNYSSLVKLSKEYHYRVCTTESCIIYEREPTPVKVNIWIVIGLSYNKYKFGSELQSDYRPGYQAGISLRFKNVLLSNDKIGLGVDLLVETNSNYTMKPFENNRYIHVKYGGVDYVLNRYPNNNFIQDLPVDIELIGLKFPLMVNYNFAFRKMSLIPAIGISNKFILSCNKEFKIANFEDQYGRTIQPYLLGFVGKVGIEKTMRNTKGLSFNFMYEYLADPFAINSLLRLRENKFSFQVGFRF
jgi:hypothetical protein